MRRKTVGLQVGFHAAAALVDPAHNWRLLIGRGRLRLLLLLELLLLLLLLNAGHHLRVHFTFAAVRRPRARLMQCGPAM